MIDLHLHTTASDGRLSPTQIVEQAVSAGVHIMAVTDHDTVAALADVTTHAPRHGVQTISGIEVTAIEEGRDVHVLGYFFDATAPALLQFLTTQRAARVDRVHAIGAKLAALGLPIDVSELLNGAILQDGRSVGRPQVARAMLAAGHVSSVQEAFDSYLATGRPAFIPRAGASVPHVIGVIHEAGGLASLAHPGQTAIDAMIRHFRDEGLDALEVFHSDHGEADCERYRALADDLGLLMTGGSDYHGDLEHGSTIASATLPQEMWERLVRASER